MVILTLNARLQSEHVPLIALMRVLLPAALGALMMIYFPFINYDFDVNASLRAIRAYSFSDGVSG